MKKSLKQLLVLGAGISTASLAAYVLMPARSVPAPQIELGTAHHAVMPASAIQVDSAPAATPSVSLESALAESDPAHRKELLEQWANSVDLRVMAETLEGMQSMPNDVLRSEASVALLKSWGNRDLEGAVKWFADRGGANGLHQQARDILAQNMAGRSPAEMVSWMEQSLPESSRKELYAPFFRQWAAADPAAAATLLGQRTNPSSASSNNPEWIDLAGQVAAQWSNTDLNSAVNWAQNLPNGPAKTLALEQVSYKWAESNPQAAATYAAQQSDPQLCKNIAAKWAETNPQAASAWANGLPEGEARNSAIASMTATWAQTDSNQVALWLQSLPQTGSRDVAVNAFSSTIVQTSPASAFQWAEAISDATMRDHQLQTVAETWIHIDPRAAKEAIAQSDLPADLKSKLLANSSIQL